MNYLSQTFNSYLKLSEYEDMKNLFFIILMAAIFVCTPELNAKVSKHRKQAPLVGQKYNSGESRPAVYKNAARFKKHTGKKTAKTSAKKSSRRIASVNKKKAPHKANHRSISSHKGKKSKKLSHKSRH